jgi:hypothetical protein
MEFGNDDSSAKASIAVRYWMHDNTFDEYYIPFENAQRKESRANLRAVSEGMLNRSVLHKALSYDEREMEDINTIRVVVQSLRETTPRNKVNLLASIARGIMYVPAREKANAWKVKPDGNTSLVDISSVWIGTKRIWTLNWPSWLISASIMASLYIAIAIQAVVAGRPNTPTTLVQVYRECIGMECNKRIYNMPSHRDFTLRLTADSEVAHYGLLGKAPEVQEKDLGERRVLGSS